MISSEPRVCRSSHWCRVDLSPRVRCTRKSVVVVALSSLIWIPVTSIGRPSRALATATPSSSIDGPTVDRVESDRSISRAEVNFVARWTSERDISLHCGRPGPVAVPVGPVRPSQWIRDNDGQHKQRCPNGRATLERFLWSRCCYSSVKTIGTAVTPWCVCVKYRHRHTTDVKLVSRNVTVFAWNNRTVTPYTLFFSRQFAIPDLSPIQSRKRPHPYSQCDCVGLCQRSISKTSSSHIPYLTFNVYCCSLTVFAFSFTTVFYIESCGVPNYHRQNYCQLTTHKASRKLYKADINTNKVKHRKHKLDSTQRVQTFASARQRRNIEPSKMPYLVIVKKWTVILNPEFRIRISTKI